MAAFNVPFVNVTVHQPGQEAQPPVPVVLVNQKLRLKGLKDVLGLQHNRILGAGHPQGIALTADNDGFIDSLPALEPGSSIEVCGVPMPAASTATGPSQTGSLKDGTLFVNVLLEHDHIQCPASLLVDTGCDLELNLSEYKADQLELRPDGFAASLEMGQGHMGRVLRRGSVLTTLILEGEGEEVTKDPRRSRYLELWTDQGTGNTSSTDGSRRSSSAGSPTSPTRSSMLQIKVLSPFLRGRDSRGHDAILGAPGMAALNLGIDKDTMRLYRKQTPKNFRKLRQQQS